MLELIARTLQLRHNHIAGNFRNLVYVLVIAGFQHIFHFKIPYFPRLKFPNLLVDFQTIYNKNGSLFSALYLVYGTVICH